MPSIVTLLGLLASLCGLALMVRFGFRYRSRLEFGNAMPATDNVDDAAIEQHNEDVKGRFGFGLVVLGIILLAAGAYWR